MFAADHPASRARQNAHDIIAAELAICIDAGSRDALAAHDGAEFLHRVLWDLDIPHDYHLLRDGDHVGPTLAPRLLQAFRWVGEHISANARLEPSAEERGLREYLASARLAASVIDPTLARTYGVLR
jgi:S-formylglutathione hydrolase